MAMGMLLSTVIGAGGDSENEEKGDEVKDVGRGKE